MPVNKNVTGVLNRVSHQDTKAGKQYSIIEVDGFAMWDWNSVWKRSDVEEGQQCEAIYQEGQFPKLKSITVAGKEVQATVPVQEEKPQTEAEPARFVGNPANSPEYLASKLAVELIKDEQIEIDKKIERFKAAFKAIREGF